MRILLALIASAGLVGCVGSIDPASSADDATTTPQGPSNPSGADLSAAKALFDANVYSTLNAKCTGGGCHSEDAQGSTLTRFVAKDASKGWSTAVGYSGLVGNFTNSAPILTKIEGGTHQGKSYTADEKTKIVAWLAKEVELRNGQSPTQPQGETLAAAADRVMAQFAGCMTLADFTAANMGPAWANINTNEGQCKRCHVNGESMFIANQDNTTAFNVISAKKMYWLQYFTVDLTQGAAAAKVIPNDVSFLGVHNRQAPHSAHPTFPYPDNNAGYTAREQFYQKTLTNIQGGQCQPKTLENY
jgi:hypothetical protein